MKKQKQKQKKHENNMRKLNVDDRKIKRKTTEVRK